MTTTTPGDAFAALLNGTAPVEADGPTQRRDAAGRFATRVPAPNRAQGASGMYRPLPADQKSRFVGMVQDALASRSPNGDPWSHAHTMELR